MKKIFLSIALLAAAVTAQTTPKFRVLVFNKPGVKAEGGTIDHASIATLSSAVVSWGKAMGFEAVPTVDPTVFTADNLAKYQVVMFNNSPILGTSLNAAQKAAYLAWAATGGTVVIHSGGDNRNSWPEFSHPGLLGTEFAGHGTGNASATADPEGKDHPVMTGAGLGTNMALEATLKMNDEMYSFISNPRGASNLKILYTIDEKTFPAEPKMGADHPITWVRDLSGGGRLFYTGWGHSTAMSTDAFFKKLVVNAMYWTAKMDGSSAVRRDASDYFRRADGFSVVSQAPATLTVFPGDLGFHTFEVNTLEGRNVFRTQGQGQSFYTIGNLNPATVYSVTVGSAEGKRSRVAKPE
jgi:cytochrome c